MILRIIGAFLDGWNSQASKKECIQADKDVREHLSEVQIDNMLKGSFPASDPPSTY
jgi:hypothetical protein